MSRVNAAIGAGEPNSCGVSDGRIVIRYWSDDGDEYAINMNTGERVQLAPDPAAIEAAIAFFDGVGISTVRDLILDNIMSVSGVASVALHNDDDGSVVASVEDLLGGVISYVVRQGGAMDAATDVIVAELAKVTVTGAQLDLAEGSAFRRIACIVGEMLEKQAAQIGCLEARVGMLITAAEPNLIAFRHANNKVAVN